MNKEADLNLDYVCRDIADRQRYRRGPKGMRNVVSELMARRGYAHTQTASKSREAWDAAVGQPMAGYTRPGNVRRGVLEVFVRNSAVVQELTFQKRKIIDQLTRLAPELKIRDLRFRVGIID